MYFRDALPTTVNVIAYAEFESVLEIDKSRNIIYDFYMDTLQIARLRANQFDLSRRRTQERTAYDDRRFAGRLGVEH